MFDKFATAVLLAVGAAGQVIYPGDNCCTFYGDSNYSTMSYMHICHLGVKEIWVDLNEHDFANKISSFWCGANVALDTCVSNDDCYRGDNTAGNVRSPQVGFNDDINMVYLKPYDVVKRGAVTIFKEVDCWGTASRYYVLENSTDASARADYSVSYLDRDVGKDDFGSVMVP